MNILRHLLPRDEEPSAPPIVCLPPPAPARPVLLVGEEFGWMPKDATLAGRKIVTALTKEDALALMAGEPLDGLIAGLPELGKNLALLNAATAAQPALACGLRADPASVAKLALSHPVIPLAHSVEVLDDLVRTMFATAQWNADPAFATLRAQIRKIPALPTLYTEITNALQKKDAPLESLAELITREPTVSAKMLQVVNSPVFGLRQRVTSLRDASNFLGIQRLRALVLSTSLIGQCDASRCQSFVPEAFENHGLQIANWAATITVGETRDRRLAELAFTAGLLSQFGVLLLASNLPESYDEVLTAAATQNVSIARIERQTYGVTHAELAGFLLASWHIPFAIVNAVGFHSTPSHSDDRAFTPLTAVHLATAIDNHGDTGQADFDRAYLDRLKLLPRLDHWSRTLAERPLPID